ADICAGDEEQQSNGREQHEQGKSRVTNEETMERREPRAHVFVRLRILLLESRGHGLELRVGRLHRATRGESRHSAHEVPAAEKILRFDVRLPAARNPDVDRLDGKGKAAWRDANELERPPIDTYAAA